MQWFLKMQHFADMALPPVMNDELKFYPAKYKNTYKTGWKYQRLVYQPPALVGTSHSGILLPEGGYVVAETAEEA